MKKVIILLVVLVCAVNLLTACGSDSIDGVYRYTGGIMNGYSADDVNSKGACYLFFNSDKTYKIYEISGDDCHELEGKWDEAYFYFKDLPLTYEYKKGILTMRNATDPSRYCPVFTKAKDSEEIKKIEDDIAKASK